MNQQNMNQQSTTQIEDRKRVVRQVQRFLRTMQIADGEKVTVPLDGIYDEATRQAVRDFQSKNKLPVTGEVDRQTYNLLYEQALAAEFKLSEPLPLYVFPNNRVITAGEVSDLVVVVQVILNVLTAGYDDFGRFELNGTYDQTMQEAIRRFQLRNGLEGTGNIDKATWNALVRNFNKYRDIPA